METDKSKYEIIQISDHEWAIQYSDGSLKRGYPKKQSALDNAAQFAEDQVFVEFVPNEPRNLEEAELRLQDAYNKYRNDVASNPSMTEEQKQRNAEEIIKAHNSMVQQQLLLHEFKNGFDPNSLVQNELTRDKQIANASKQRDDLTNQASLINKSNESDNAKRSAENEAFQAELYYQSLKQQQQQGGLQTGQGGVQSATTPTPSSSLDTTSFSQVNVANNAETRTSNTSGTDLMRSPINSSFGSITQSGNNSTSRTSGYGYSTNRGTQVYDTSLGVTTVSSSSDQRVRLSPKPSIRGQMLTGVLEPLAETGGLVFPYTPNITYQTSANYNILELTHANTDWHLYKNTPSVELNIQGLFTSQNEVEAKYTLACIHFLRTLTKMHFGASDPNKGLPPPQVVLDGYGTHMFNGLSVILKSYDVALPDDVDYVEVKSAGGISKVPAVTTLNITVIVQQTPSKAKSFNWDEFASGNLMQSKGWI